MPDNLFSEIIDIVRPALSVEARSRAAEIEGIKRDRVALPTHDLQGVNFRKHFAAVCRAEVAHAHHDYLRITRDDSQADTFGKHVSEAYRLPHEAWAAQALNIDAHLVSVKTTIRNALDIMKRRAGFANWHEDRPGYVEYVRAELKRRRAIWRAFLDASSRYHAARGK